MSDPNQPSTPAGWYPDGQGGQRWWDGTQWTEHTQAAQGATPDEPAAPAEPTPPAESTPFDPNQTVVAPRTPAQGLPPQAGSGQPPVGPPAAQSGMQSGYQQPGVPGAPPWQGQTPTTGGGGGGKGKLIAIVAAALVLVVVAAVVLFTVVLGGGGPKGVAEDYLEATLDLDIEKVCDLSSKDSQDSEFEDYEVKSCSEYQDKFMDQENYDQLRDLFDNVDTEVKIGEVKEKGDSATVEYTETIEYTGDDEDAFKEFFDDTKATEKGTLTLVKEDGDWKVDSDESE